MRGTISSAGVVGRMPVSKLKAGRVCVKNGWKHWKRNSLREAFAGPDVNPDGNVAEIFDSTI